MPPLQMIFLFLQMNPKPARSPELASEAYVFMVTRSQELSYSQNLIKLQSFWKANVKHLSGT